MSPLTLRGGLVKYALAATAHGLSDLDGEWRRLLPYCVLLPLHVPGVSVAFIAASVAHFAVDIGYRNSAFGHAAIAACATVAPRCASNAFCAFYVTVHVPNTLERLHRRAPRLAVALACTIGASMCAAACTECDVVCVGDAAQRLVIAHVIASAMG